VSTGEITWVVQIHTARERETQSFLFNSPNSEMFRGLFLVVGTILQPNAWEGTWK
jgi:hypothetical protein